MNVGIFQYILKVLFYELIVKIDNFFGSDYALKHFFLTKISLKLSEISNDKTIHI